MSKPTVSVDLTSEEVHVLTCAMAGNFPPFLNDARMPVLRKLARADQALPEFDHRMNLRDLRTATDARARKASGGE